MLAIMADDRIVAEGIEATILERIGDAATQLALWRRPLPMELDWLDALDWDAVDDIDFHASLTGLKTAVGSQLVEAGYPSDEKGMALRDEIVAMACRFAAILGCDWVKIRLDVIQTDACRKFHADMVIARLLTTLSGPATQWIRAEEPDHVQQLATGDVGIFKGRLWAEDPAILHRSPPISASGDTRLLLVIDPFDSISGAA